MNILRFNEELPTEEVCKFHFRARPGKEGVNFKMCGCKEHYWLKANSQGQCKYCDFCTTLKSGSIMEGSQVNFLT